MCRIFEQPVLRSGDWRRHQRNMLLGAFDIPAPSSMQGGFSTCHTRPHTGDNAEC